MSAILFFNRKKKQKQKYEQLQREYHYVQPVYEYIMPDVPWIELTRKLVRFLVAQFEKAYEEQGFSKEKASSLDDSTAEYLSSLIRFFNNRVSTLLPYFSQCSEPSIQKCPSVEFFLGHLTLIDKVLKPIISEVDKGELSLSNLRYLHNYVFCFYLDIVEGIRNVERVSKELEEVAKALSLSKKPI